MHRFLSPSELGFGQRARPRIGRWPRSEDAWLLVYLLLQITRCGRIHLPKKVANLWITKCQSYLWAEVLAALLLAFIKLCMNMIRPFAVFLSDRFREKEFAFPLWPERRRSWTFCLAFQTGCMKNLLKRGQLTMLWLKLTRLEFRGNFVSVDTSSTFNEARHAHLKQARTRWARSIVESLVSNRCHLWR